MQPGDHVDRYVVERVLGQGAMAEVYLVRHKTLETHHALKVLLQAGRHVRERLIGEGKVQAQLRHPNVVAVTDVLEVDGAPGLLMEFVDGPSLFEWLYRNRPDLAETQRLFRGIVEGVARAHGLGVVHRDLKPANILLARERGVLVPKVADFGLAKALEEDGHHGRSTRTGTAMGTPSYMAPEQILDAKNAGPEADIFALGCILYEMVVGEMAYDGPNLLAIFNAVQKGDCPPIRERVPTLPGHLAQAIEGAMCVQQAHRIGSCEELLAVLAGERTWSPPTVESGETFGFEAASPAAAATLEPAPQAAAGGALGLHEAETAARPRPPRRSPPPTAPADSLSTMDPGVALQAPPAERSRWWIPLVGAAGVLAGLLAVGVGILALSWESGEGPPPPGPAPAAEVAVDRAPEAPTDPETVEDEGPIVQPEEAQPPPKAPKAAAPERSVEPKPIPEPEPVEEPEVPADPVAAGTHGHVGVTGSAKVSLRQGTHEVPVPGAVPSGTWAVWADFGAGPAQQQDLVVPGGQRVTLKCDALLRTCQRPR